MSCIYFKLQTNAQNIIKSFLKTGHILCLELGVVSLQAKWCKTGFPNLQLNFRPAVLFPVTHRHRLVEVSKLLFCRHVSHHINLFPSSTGEVLFAFTTAAKRAKSVIWAAKHDLLNAITCFMRCKWSWIHYLSPAIGAITLKSGTLLYKVLLC